jgi:hypothetical protein
MDDSSIYLYDKTNKGFEFFIGGCSVANGLSFLTGDTGIRITSFGATCFKNYGWATESELPEIRTVAEAVSFLTSEGDIGLVEFEAELSGIGRLCTHDGQECHFVLLSRQICMSLMKSAIPSEHGNLLINKLVSSPGIYMGFSTSSGVSKYSSFDEYINQRNG